MYAIRSYAYIIRSYTSFPRGDLRRREEEDEIAAEGVEHQRGNSAEDDESGQDQQQAFMTGLQRESLRG